VVELKNTAGRVYVMDGDVVECDGAGTGTEVDCTFLTGTGRGRNSIIFTGQWRIKSLTSAQASKIISL